jgi:hypothetical protein
MGMVILGRKRVDCNQLMRDGQPGKGTEVTAGGGEDVSLHYMMGFELGGRKGRGFLGF